MLVTADCTQARVYQQTALGGAFTLIDAFELPASAGEEAARRFTGVLSRYIEQAFRREEFSELVLSVPRRMQERILQQLSPETVQRLRPALDEALRPLIASERNVPPRKQEAQPQAA
jgi:GAF domain-containing protein